MAIHPYRNMVNLMRVGTILDTGQWKVKIYAPPREHGPPHVHILCKSSTAEVKISLHDIKVLGPTRFDRRTVRSIIQYVYENRDLLLEVWEGLHGKKEKT